MSHAVHTSCHAERWRSSASSKFTYRRADVPALTSVSLVAGSREVKKVTSFSTRTADPWRTSNVSTCWT
jgi:hypothetical protein